MTGQGFEVGFRQILAKESLAEKYRDFLRRQRRAQERQKYPFVVLVWNYLACRAGRLFKSSLAGTGPGTGFSGSRPEGFLALDSHSAAERKELYIRDERIAVYTAFFGPYDQLREPLLQPDNIDYYILTDQPVPEERLSSERFHAHNSSS